MCIQLLQHTVARFYLNRTMSSWNPIHARAHRTKHRDASALTVLNIVSQRSLTRTHTHTHASRTHECISDALHCAHSIALSSLVKRRASRAQRRPAASLNVQMCIASPRVASLICAAYFRGRKRARKNTRRPRLMCCAWLLLIYGCVRMVYLFSYIPIVLGIEAENIYIIYVVLCHKMC